MTILLTDEERQQAAHFEMMRGAFPVLTESQREQRWHRKIHLPTLMRSLTLQHANARICCANCGCNGPGVQSNGNVRSWWVDVNARTIHCWTCQRQRGGRFERFVLPDGWGFTPRTGSRGPFLMQATPCDWLFLMHYPETGYEAAHWKIWTARDSNVLGAGGHQLIFPTRSAATRFALEYSADPTPANLTRLYRADRRCTNSLEGRRCRSVPGHPGQHRWWSARSDEIRWH
jgi:hypothetical protein